MSMRSSVHKSKSGGKADGGKAGHGHVCDVTCIHPDAVEAVRDGLVDRQTSLELSRIFQVMADPTRLRIVSLLAQRELCVCDIAAALDMTQSAVSHQLRVMRISRLVNCRREGRIVYYFLDDDHVLKLFTQGLDHAGHTELTPPPGR